VQGNTSAAVDVLNDMLQYDKVCVYVCVCVCMCVYVCVCVCVCVWYVCMGGQFGDSRLLTHCPYVPMTYVTDTLPYPPYPPYPPPHPHPTNTLPYILPILPIRQPIHYILHPYTHTHTPIPIHPYTHNTYKHTHIHP
jgi:hypothetical protein